MHLLVDFREACNPRKTGKGLWAEHLVRALAARDVPMTLLTNAPLPEGFPRPPHVTIRRLDQKGAWWHFAALRLLRRSPGVTYLSPTSHIVPFLAGYGAPTIAVVHDLIAFRGEPHDRKATLIERLTLGRAARCALRVFTISDATRDDLLRRFPSLDPARVTTIGAGPVHSGQPRNDDAAGRGILCAGTLCPRKNQLRLLQAYAQLPEPLRRAHPLFLAGGRGWHDDEIVDCAERTPGVQLLGYVQDDALKKLYDDAAVLAMPSLYEGFGLPVLTAMQRGRAVLTSNRGSLREVAGGAALMVDPESVDDIRNGLERLLTDEHLRSDLRAKGIARARMFSWETVAERFLAPLR